MASCCFENVFIFCNFEFLFFRWKKAFKYQVSVKHTLHEFPPAAPFFSLSESVEIVQPLRHKRKSSEMYEAYDVLR